MINLHESMGPGRDQTWDPWICSHYHECEDEINNIYHDIRKKKNCVSYRTHNAVGKTDKPENITPLLLPNKDFFWVGGGRNRNTGK